MRYLNKHANREKELRRLDRERGRLWHATREAPLVPLEHPLQRGWMKTYVLAKGIDRRPDAAIFRSMLAAVNQRVYSDERSFVDRFTGRPIALQPRLLSFDELESHGWPVSHRRFFERGPWRINGVLVRAADRVDGSATYKLVRTWWLREEVQPDLITHRRVDLPDVETRLAEIEARLTHTCGQDRLTRLYGSSHWWRRYNNTRAELQSRHALAEQMRETTAE
jgi:hypothetical protein